MEDSANKFSERNQFERSALVTCLKCPRNFEKQAGYGIVYHLSSKTR